MPGKIEPVALGPAQEGIRSMADRAAEILDMRYDPEGIWETPPGLYRILETTANKPVVGLFVFQQRPNQTHFVLEVANSETEALIQRARWPAGTVQTVDTRRRSAGVDGGTQFLQNGRWLYMFSSTDSPRRWDSNQVLPVGFSSVPAPPRVQGGDQGLSMDVVDQASRDFSTPTQNLSTQRGVGPEAAADGIGAEWRLGYAITLVNDQGQESPPSALAFASGTNDESTLFGRLLCRVGWDRQAPNIRAVRLWRTLNLIHGDPLLTRGLTLYLHSEYATANAVDLWDHTPDDELGVVTLDPQFAGLMPIAPRAAGFWQGGMWLGGASNDPTRLYYSYPGFPEQFPSNNYLIVGSPKTGAVVALVVTQRGLIVFKEHGVYLVRGSYAAGFTVTPLDETVGCAAPRAVELVPHLNAVAFLDASGPHLVVLANDDEAARVERLAGCRRTWRLEVGSDLTGARVVHDAEFGEIWWLVPRGGYPFPDLGLVLHYRHPAGTGWSLRRGWGILSLHEHRGRVYAGGVQEDLYVLTRASAAKSLVDSGLNMESSYLTGVFESPERQGVNEALVTVVGLGRAAAVHVDLETDRTENERRQTATARAAQHTTHNRDVWGTAVWSAARLWTDLDPARVPVALGDKVAWAHQVRISAASLTAAPARIGLAALELRVDDESHRPHPTRRP